MSSSVKIEKRSRPISESVILSAIRDAISRRPGALVFRNQVGMLHNERGTPVRYGLAVGSADLIGSVLVNGFARPLAIEVKRPGGIVSADQSRWLELVRSNGWIAGVCTSVDEANQLIEMAAT